jgi:hypothetical protein
MSGKVLIIVPAYNEAGSIRPTVEEIRRGAPDMDVVVIDDGSSDATRAEALQAGARVVSLPFNLGIGGAVQTGFRFAAANGYDAAVQMDGDGQHDIAFLGALLRPVLDGKTDIAVGSRFIPPFLGYRSSWVRRAGIHFFAALTSLLTGCRVTDPTSGFRAFSRRAVAVFARDYPQDFPEPESIVIARKTGLGLVEVPVRMRKRLAGHSSIRYLKTLYYMVKVTCAILIHTIRARKDVSRYEC